MIRKAFKMKLYPHALEEYVHRHNPIWKSLASILKEHGVSNYSIFYDGTTHHLFGYAEVESQEAWEAIAKTTECQKWWEYMADLMETNADNSPVSFGLEEVFHLA